MRVFAPSAHRPSNRRRLVLPMAFAVAIASHGSAHADERAELEQLRATTTALIQALVEQGLLSRERADALLKQALPRSADAAAAAAPVASGTGATSLARAAPPVVRVPYIPESLKTQIKNDIRLDVLATAREEGWADARQLPPWLRSLTFEGDFRLRAEGGIFGKGNLPAEVYRSQVESPAWSPDLTNTQTDRNRLTVRARFGVTAKVGDEVAMGIRFASGSNTSPATESQTLGNDFNRYTVGIDRAFLRWEPREDLRLEGGRIANPYFGSDLLFPDDLSLDGVAISANPRIVGGVNAFATLGAFALEELPLKSADKWLLGAQIGADVALGDKTQLRIGASFYDFRNIEGVRETDPPPSGPRAGTVPYLSSQYPTSLRQRGNTLINLNDPTSTASPVWGLASKFRPINVTGQVILRQFEPAQLSIVADYVKNSAFNLADIRRRAGTDAVADLADRTTGYQLRLQAGAGKLASRGDWLAYVALRRFERDAWVDGLTDTTWNLGGTNYKGYGLGATYTFDRNSTIGLRWTSTQNLDDGRRSLAIPGDPTSLTGNLSSAPFKVDVIQLEVNTRF